MLLSALQTKTEWEIMIICVPASLFCKIPELRIEENPHYSGSFIVYISAFAVESESCVSFPHLQSISQ